MGVHAAKGARFVSTYKPSTGCNPGAGPGLDPAVGGPGLGGTDDCTAGHRGAGLGLGLPVAELLRARDAEVLGLRRGNVAPRRRRAAPGGRR